MTIEDLYKPFSAQKQLEYQNWLVETYGPDMAAAVAKIQAHARNHTANQSEAPLKRLQEVEAALVNSYEAGVSPDSADLTAHQAWVAEMWGYPCDANAYGKLSEIYLAHPDFIARFEALSAGFSKWLSTAMIAWSERR